MGDRHFCGAAKVCPFMDGPVAIHAWSLRALFGSVFLSALVLAPGAEAPERTCMIGTGRSMLPTLPEICRMVVVRVPLDEVKAGARDGDIIATRLNGIEVVHRAVSRRPDGSLVTRGDNNAQPDTDVTTERNYVGVVVGFEKPGAVGELLVPAPRLLSRQVNR